ncbi:hypothetical protein GCK72_007733 [Caenorhabditis remanei]|uniref:Uncharacterized protein n=1 Tax=Caenorhabditis remanei TaxID=31234 RepID=A0A6A5HME3_CAERE|nr:hypothetical protein GCK72_007733 [Caenorhabditis remanei]KAF1767774.1 hypothetical protein GCK72_007733 [Caenorhabditis remanei]
MVRKWSSRDSDDEFSMHGRRGEFSDSERSWGEDWKSGRSSRYSARNEVMMEMVEMLGQRRRVVIDSGAVVSVISTSAYERLKAGCRDWEKEVEVFGKPTFTVLNASNSKMRVRGQIKIPMVFIGGEKELERPGEKLRKVPTEVSGIQCKSVAVRGERGRRASTGDVGEVFKSEGEEKERKKVKIRASVAVIGPRLEARGPGVLEYRNKTITGWTQKFDWGEVKEAVVLVEYTDKEDENSKRVEFVKSVAKEVEKVWMMPRSLQCEFGDVDNVAKQWKEWLKTSANAEVVDPLMPVGNHKTPLILERWHRKSLDGLQKYLHNALPSRPVRCQCEKTADRRPQSGLRKDLGKGCPIAERRGKWLRRSSTFSKPHGITDIKGNE